MTTPPAQSKPSVSGVSWILGLVGLWISLVGLLGVIVPRSIKFPGLLVPTIGSGLTVLVFVRSIRNSRAAYSKEARIIDGGAVVAISLLLGGLGKRGTGWPFLGPVGRSVDISAHVAIPEWILRHGHLPATIQPELAQFSEYFMLIHRAAADLARLSGLTPPRAVGLLGLVVVGGVFLGAATLTDAMVVASSGSRTTMTRLIGFFGVFVLGILAHSFTIDALVRSYFFAHLAGVFLCTCACVCLLRPELRRLVPFIGAASMATYPLQAPVFPAMVLVCFFVTRDRSFLRALWTSVGLGAVALLAQAPYLGGSLQMSQQEGAITHLGWKTAGGTIVALLIATGTGMMASQSRLAFKGRALTPAILTASGLLITGAEYAAFKLGGLLGFVSEYSGDKVAFLIAPFAMAAGGFALSHGLNVLQHLGVAQVIGAWSVILSGALVGCLGVIVRDNIREVHPYFDSDGYNVARGVVRLQPPETVGVLGSPLPAYQLWWTALRRPVTPTVYELYGNDDGQSPWRRWPQVGGERRMVVVGEPWISIMRLREKNGAPIKELRKQGNAVVFGKS